MNSQQEFFMPGTTRTPALVDENVIGRVPSMKEAIRLCMNLSGFTYQRIGEHLGIDPGHLTRILQGSAHFPDDKLPELMAFCGNYAPLQYLARVCNFKLSRETERERQIQELRNQLEALEREAS